jgi:hypothetical protein
MRISKEVSGNAMRRDDPTRQGRGEFEWCDICGDDPSREDLVQRQILLALPGDIIINTSCIFGFQGGKWRIRTVDRSREIYPNWQIAAALLMPRQTRKEQHWGQGAPVMRASQYCVIHVNLGAVTLERNSKARCEVVTAEVSNRDSKFVIGVSERFAHVRAIWASANSHFDEPLSGLIIQHERAVKSGKPLGAEIHKLVDNLQATAAKHAADYGVVGNALNADVLPTLLQIAQCRTLPQPQVQIETIPFQEILIRRREVKKWRQWVASRGAESVHFRRVVREAYRSTCIVCGLCLPTVASGSNPGVDAAHILPWAQFDLDHINNGLCLCKLHHWAFDDGLIAITFDGENYRVTIPPEIEDDMMDVPEFTLAYLRNAVGVIPIERLPVERAHWPSPQLLEKLRQMLG